MRLPRVTASTLLSVTALTVALPALTGCDSGHRPAQPVSPSAVAPTGPRDAWGQLAARVAAAQDHRYLASYTFTRGNKAPETVTVTVAGDGSWLVVVPGGGLGGTADIAVAGTAAGLYQCEVGGGSPGCVRAAGPGGALPEAADPRLQYLFTSWLSVLTNRSEPLAVSVVKPPTGMTGTCFAIESNSTALAPPLDPGIYCYREDGTMTGAVLGMGRLMLAAGPVAAPPTVTLPAPIVPGSPVPTASPPPSPSPKATP